MFFVIFLYITRYCQFKSRFVADNVGGCAFVDFLFAVAVDKALDKTYIIADAIELFPLGKNNFRVAGKIFTCFFRACAIQIININIAVRQSCCFVC